MTVKNVSYKMVLPGVVEIQDSFNKTRLNEHSLILAIANVKRNRADYATERAHNLRVERLEGALTFLQSQRR